MRAAMGLELRLDAGDAVELSSAPQIHDRIRRFRANDRRLLQLAREMKVIGAADDDADASTRTVDFGVAANGGTFRHDIDAFDHGIRRGESDVGRAQRVDREKADIPCVRRDPGDDLAGCVVGHELDRHAQLQSKFARRSTEMPQGSPAASLPARTGLPKLIAARSLPVGARSETAAEAMCAKGTVYFSNCTGSSGFATNATTSAGGSGCLRHSRARSERESILCPITRCSIWPAIDRFNVSP